MPDTRHKNTQPLQLVTASVNKYIAPERAIYFKFTRKAKRNKDVCGKEKADIIKNNISSIVAMD